MKKYLLLVFIFGLVITSVNLKFADSQLTNCPDRTTATSRSITFVGKAGLGGDKEVALWFEYGDSEENLSYKTKILKLYHDGVFCIKETKNIKPCRTYYYRAVARNFAGTNYGEVKNIKTLCFNKTLQTKTKDRKWIVF